MRIAELEESLKSLIKESTQIPTDQELSFGMIGKNIEDYQAALQSIGITPGPIDGKFGRETKAATMVFQNKQHLTPDGIAGKRTINSLNQLLKFGNSQPQSKEKPKTKSKMISGSQAPL
jgi:peptidoglycan hydrolase-like protein with peptidoglycan-binding domain